jgi:hypothetical protein
LFDVGNVYNLTLPEASFHAQLAKAAPRLFADADFERLYATTRGRPSVPPSLLALTLLLQQQAGVSDQEAIERTAYDLRWNAVLGRSAGTPLCAKSTLQLFRAHLILHEQARQIFVQSLEEAKRAGLLQKSLRVAIDTKPILGRGAVEDTFNLLATGIRQLARALSRQSGQRLETFLTEAGLARYTHASLKGSTDLDWADPQEKDAFLTQIVAEARHLLTLAGGTDANVRAAATLLEALLLQDVQETPQPDGAPTATVKTGTTPGRRPSATDPDVRHGRKSASKTFTGHKASVACDIDSQLVVAVAVLGGDAPDNTDALALVQQAATNTALAVAEALGDCAYGDGATRQAFAEAEIAFHAKVPKEVEPQGCFPKSAFAIDLEALTVTCPAGHTLGAGVPVPSRGLQFRFGRLCRDCPLRARCSSARNGRTLTLHPQEARLQAARAYQHSTEGKVHLRQRVAVEHALARLSGLGIGQARYIGRVKTGFQLLLAATVANLRRTWNWQAQTPYPPSAAAIIGRFAAFWRFLAAFLSSFLRRPDLPPCRGRLVTQVS